MLHVDHLRKAYGDRVAVEDVSFSVAAGEVFGLLGPNGAGKTTTMSIVCGLLPADGGRVEIDGRALVDHGHELGHVLGLVPQDLAIYPDLTGRENCDFFGRLYGLRGRRLRERVASALDRVGLSKRADDLVATYSGGMKRRLNFAVAVLHEPRLVILDEPTVGVDPQSRSHLLDLVRELAANGVAVVYASHYMEEVEAICRRVAIVDHGRMLACDTLVALLARVERITQLRVRDHDGLATKLGGFADVEGGADGELVVSLHEADTIDETRLAEALGRVMRIVGDAGGHVLSIHTRDPSLERLFLELTGRGLRD